MNAQSYFGNVWFQAELAPIPYGVFCEMNLKWSFSTKTGRYQRSWRWLIIQQQKYNYIETRYGWASQQECYEDIHGDRSRVCSTFLLIINYFVLLIGMYVGMAITPVSPCTGPTSRVLYTIYRVLWWASAWIHISSIEFILQFAYGAFVRQSLQHKRKPVKRNYFAQEDVRYYLFQYNWHS